MNKASRHHYQVQTYRLPSKEIVGRQCFEASTGAVAYMIGRGEAVGDDEFFRVVCLTYGTCTNCQGRAFP